MEDIIGNYKRYFSDRKYIGSLIVSLISLCVGFLVNYYTSIFATSHAGNQVTDIILSNIPIYDVDRIFIFGPLVVWTFFVILLIKDPRRIPFALKTITLFIIIRALFTTLTHLGPYPYEIPIGYTGNWIKSFTFGGDLFFSGHTGLPFLMGLIFGKINKFYYYIFFSAAVFFGVIVLLGHYHYSIDVAAAFFITYSIYVIATKWFKRDMDRFYSQGE